MTTRPPLVLVVEDDVEVARMLRDILAEEGYRVALAHDGEAALFECAIEDPSVILLDVYLPKMSGSEFLAWYRARADAGARIIGLSGLIGPDVDALELDDFVGKPFELGDLLRRVSAQALGRDQRAS